jgi:hypothetical protein
VRVVYDEQSAGAYSGNSGECAGIPAFGHAVDEHKIQRLRSFLLDEGRVLRGFGIQKMQRYVSNVLRAQSLLKAGEPRRVCFD